MKIMGKSMVFAWMAVVLSCNPLPGFCQDAKTYYEEGVEHFKKEEYDAAIESFQKVIDINPEMAAVYNFLGLTYLKQNQSIESAIGSFREAIRIDPHYAEAYFNLATTYASYADEADKAAEYFQKTIDVDPAYSRAYFGLGWFSLTEKRDPKKAAEYFDKTLQLYPDFEEAYYGMGLTQLQLGKSHLMIELISKLRSLNREDLATLLERAMRGEIAIDQEMTEKADYADLDEEELEDQSFSSNF